MDNKIIAEFMEIEIFDEEYTEALLIASALDLPVNPCTHFDNILDTVYLEDFSFDCSWDWLMPVVEEIESKGYAVTITQNVCTIQECVMGGRRVITRQTGNYREADTKISNTYKAVTKFLKWYKTK